MVIEVDYQFMVSYGSRNLKYMYIYLYGQITTFIKDTDDNMSVHMNWRTQQEYFKEGRLATLETVDIL